MTPGKGAPKGSPYHPDLWGGSFDEKIDGGGASRTITATELTLESHPVAAERSLGANLSPLTPSSPPAVLSVLVPVKIPNRYFPSRLPTELPSSTSVFSQPCPSTAEWAVSSLQTTVLYSLLSTSWVSLPSDTPRKGTLMPTSPEGHLTPRIQPNWLHQGACAQLAPVYRALGPAAKTTLRSPSLWDWLESNCSIV